ncbi:MAG: type II secretion system F family protein [Candidatus Methylacidiphilales bacterium]
MDLMILYIAVATILFFVVCASIMGSFLVKPEKKTVKSRVARMREIEEELKGELPGLTEEKKPTSLLSNIDLRPTLGKFVNENYFTDLEKDLARADIPLRVSEFIIFRLAIVFFIMAAAVILTQNFLLGIVIGLPFLVVHIPVIKLLQSMRVNKFSNQLANFLTLIVNSLRAGQTFMQGCSIAVKESPDPIAAEFKQVIKEVNLGMPEAESMENMLIRVPSEDLKIVVSAYLVQRKVGGNLAEIFDTTAQTIRERIKIQGKISALTTQGKLSGILVGVLPFLLGFVLTLLNPDYMGPLISTLPGYVVIGFGILLQLTGFIVIWKIVSIEI